MEFCAFASSGAAFDKAASGVLPLNTTASGKLTLDSCNASVAGVSTSCAAVGSGRFRSHIAKATAESTTKIRPKMYDAHSLDFGQLGVLSLSFADAFGLGDDWSDSSRSAVMNEADCKSTLGGSSPRPLVLETRSDCGS